MENFFDTLRKNENAKIIVGLPKVKGAEGAREAITAYAVTETTIAGAAQYNEPGMEAFGQLFTTANNALNQVGAMAGSFASSAGSPSMLNRQFKTIHSTIATWTGSDKFRFTLQLRFYAIDKKDDVRIPVRRFLECVYPIFDNAVPGMMIAPNMYDYTEKNCLSVKIGRWFRTPALFIVRSVNFQFSKETITGGNPLFAEGTVMLESYRLLSGEEVSGFLISSVTGSTDTKQETTNLYSS